MSWAAAERNDHVRRRQNKRGNAWVGGPAHYPGEFDRLFMPNALKAARTLRTVLRTNGLRPVLG